LSNACLCPALIKIFYIIELNSIIQKKKEKLFVIISLRVHFKPREEYRYNLTLPA